MKLNEVQLELFPGLGIYSGIFAMYLQCQSDKSTAVWHWQDGNHCFLSDLSSIRFIYY